MKFIKLHIAALFALSLAALSACSTPPRAAASNTTTASGNSPTIYDYPPDKVQTIYVFDEDGGWNTESIRGALYQRTADSIRATGTPANPLDKSQYFSWRNVEGAPCSITVGPRELLKVCPTPLPYDTLCGIAADQICQP